MIDIFVALILLEGYTESLICRETGRLFHKIYDMEKVLLFLKIY